VVGEHDDDDVAVRETPQLDSALGVNMNGDCFGGNHDCCRDLPDFSLRRTMGGGLYRFL